MNYTKTLQERVKDSEQARREANEAAYALRAYLLSDKFRCGSDLDNYVNIGDVLARLTSITDALSC
jgi:hypothetical protein